MEAVTSRSYSRPIWISWDSLTSDNCFAPVAGFVAHAAVHAARRPAVTRRPPGRGRGGSMGALLSINDRLGKIHRWGWLQAESRTTRCCAVRVEGRRRTSVLQDALGPRAPFKGVQQSTAGLIRAFFSTGA